MSMLDQAKPVIGVVMGSSSDWDVMKNAVDILKQFGVPHEALVISAHRMPDEMFAYAEGARARGLRAIIAGAFRVREHFVRHAVGGNDQRFMRHAELLQDVDGVLHDVPVG